MNEKMLLKRLACILAGLAMLLMPVLGTAGEGRKTMSLYGGKSGPVDFNHHLHQAVVEDCSVCHKDFPQEKGALEANKKSGALKEKQVMNKTCLKCHRAKKKAGEKTGPVSCKQCHKK